LLGLSGGLALAAKFSALMHLPIAMLAMAAWHLYNRPVAWKKYLPAIPLILAMAVFTIAAAYRFDPVEPIMNGIRQVMDKNAQGHANVFWGDLRPSGHWLYFPVVWLL